MSSYFVNSSFPVIPGAGGGGQAAAEPPFLGQISLYPSGYTDHPLRHYPGAAAVTAAAAVAYSAGGGEKAYPGSTYYQQAANGAYGGHRAAAAAGVGVAGGAAGAGACDYTAAAAAAAAAAATNFYRDKELSGLDELALSQDGMHRKVDCGVLGGKGLFVDAMDDKQASSAPIYPWMQRMNACNGECAPLPLSASFFLLTNPFIKLSLCFRSEPSLFLLRSVSRRLTRRLLPCQSVMSRMFYCAS